MKKRLNFYYHFFKNREVASLALPLEPSNNSVSAAIGNDHKALCLSLVENLVQRGSLSSAQRVIQRMVSHSSSVSVAISAVDFATLRGLNLNLDVYGVLIRKLVSSGELNLAEFVYSHVVSSRGIDPDEAISASMVICFCKLGKLEEGRTLLDRLFMLGSVPSKATCNAILRALYNQEMVLDAFDFYVWISDAGLLLGSWCNRLIDGLSIRGYVDEARYVFDIMLNRIGYSPTVHMYKSLFYGLCKRGRVVEAELLFGEMESQGLYIDKTMYTCLIFEYCRSKKLKMAMRVFLRMLKMGCEPDNHTCNTLIHGFVKLGLFDKGWVISNQMREWGLQPDVITYGIMINQYCKEGKSDSALMLLKTMVRCNLIPSVYCYTDLINALNKENKLIEVDELYKGMIDSGVVPDHVLYFFLTKNYPKEQELQLALLVLQAIAKNGCGIDPFSLSASASLGSSRDLMQEIDVLLGEIVRSNLSLAATGFSIYICALCMSGKVDIAMYCLDRMVSLGCKPSVFTYNSLIKCLCQVGLFDDVKTLIECMEEQGVVPDLATYLIMVNEHCIQGDLESALSVLDQMDHMGIKPSVAIYDSVIGCLGKQKRVLEAELLFKKMLENGVDPDEVVYTTMILAYVKNGRVIEARQLFEKMMEHSIQPGLYSYTALISGLVKKNRTDKGCEYLSRMLKDGLLPNVVLYTSLISNSLKNGELDDAFRLVDLMEKNQIEWDLVTYIAVVSGVCRNITGVQKKWHILSTESQRERQMLFLLLHQNTLLTKENNLSDHFNSSEEIKGFAVKMIRKIKNIRFMPNLYLYNCVISGFCRAQRMEEAYENFESMQKEGLLPNQVTYTLLMNGHIQSGDIDSAMEIFNKMNADGCVPDRIACNTLLRGLCKAGRPFDALSLSYTMRKRGFFPNKVSYEDLLNCLCASYMGDEAFKIFEEMITLDYLPRRSDHNWIHKMMFDIMLERGQLMNNATKLRFVRG